MGTASKRRRAWLLGGGVALLGAIVAAYLLLSGDRPESDRLLSSVAELPASPPTRLCVRDLSAPCRTAPEVEELLGLSELEPEAAAVPPSGTQGALALALKTAEGEHVLAKWRGQREALVNDPAKELAAYETQKLFLEPEDYVIPPTAGRCLEPDSLADATGLHEQEPVADTNCALGFLSYWLSDAIDMDAARRQGHHAGGEPGDRDPKLFDATRFESEPAYRRNVANLNVLMVLIDNGDLHSGQFLLYPEADHWFVVDSSVAFESWQNPTLLLSQDLSELLVPSIPAALAERIRSIPREDVESLAVLAEWTVGEDGQLTRTRSGGRVVGDPDDRVRVAEGRVQVGLAPDEIAGLWSRLERLRARLEDGTLRTF